jgi:hypothetical protein
MSILPPKVEEFLTWCENHGPVWNTNATNLGLTVAEVQAFMVLVTEARQAWAAKEAAYDAARAATVVSQDTVRDARREAAELLRDIKAFAEAQSKPATVYALAQIPPPAAPTPAPPPAQPTDLSVTIEPGSGALTLRWKAKNPAGTSGTGYIIRRKAAGEIAFSFVGVTGTKFFTDDTFQAGPDSVEYTVQGTRAGVNGPASNVFLVRFGAGGGDGTFQAFVTDTGAGAKLAA